MRFWERPLIQLLAVFLLLGLFAWWTFQTVSLPPVLRDLFEEDEAIATAATPATEEEQFQQELARLPSPPENHAPEVAALRERLRNLPPIPYIVSNAMARDTATPKGETPPPWSDLELQNLRSIQAAYFGAWEPFLSGPAPDWKNFPDSILFFRSKTSPILATSKDYAKILQYVPGGQSEQPSWTWVEFSVKYLRQAQGVGAVRFGVGLSSWSMTDTVSTAEMARKITTSLITQDNYPLEDLQALRAILPAEPSLENLRDGLDGDRSLFLRTADFLESLPPSTAAKTGIVKWLQDDSDAEWYLRKAGQPPLANDLAALLRRDAEQLEILRQKTFLPGPAWRQWLSGNPGAGLTPMLAQGLGGFKEFEATRQAYRVTQAALDARIALEEGGINAARRIPDPARSGSFLQVEETESGIRISSFYTPEGQTNALSFLVPASSAAAP